MKRDYYEVLGVDRNADEAAIRQAYRRLAIKCHPDRNPGDSHAVERMKEINEAYAILIDPEKRRLYDAYGHAGLEGYTADDIFGGIDFASILSELGLRDVFSHLAHGWGGRSIFDDFFGNPAGRARELEWEKGADLEVELEINLEEAFRGAVRKIKVPKAEVCQECRGTGAARGGISSCPDCGGSGQIVRERRSGYSVFRQISTCARCRGQGRTVTRPCRNCEGRGIVETEREVSVPIPRGADTGAVIKLEGEGEMRRRGRPGDLFVKIRVADHPVFQRRGSDILVTKEITITQALLGGKVYGVPCLDGETMIELPQGTADGSIVKIPGKGMFRSDDRRGDEYVILRVGLPRNLSCEEVALLREFERLRIQNLDPLFLSQRCFGPPALPPSGDVWNREREKEPVNE